MALTRRKAEIRQTEPALSTVDPDIRDVLGPPPLLEAEDAGAYRALLDQIREAVVPKDALEEFWVRDVVDLIWETRRWRRLRVKLFQAAAHLGLDKLLEPLLGFRMNDDLVKRWARREPEAIKEVNSLLKKAGLDHESITVQTLTVKLDTFEKIDRMIMNTETRRNIILREIDRHRDVLAQRLREAAIAIEAEYKEVETMRDAAE